MRARSVIGLASTSTHKADELARLLGRPIAAIAGYQAPIEDGTTFAENALIKARAGHLQAATAEWVVADDSGLVVEALGGAPGIHSARFGEPSLDDAGRVTHLLERLGNAADRRAAFVCVLAAIGSDGTVHVAEGRVEGAISRAPSGRNGFGYDPVFVPAGETRTVGEMESAEKDALSHRSRAAASLRRMLGW
jgi:XTP/dITP diphosphohydrolase